MNTINQPTYRPQGHVFVDDVGGELGRDVRVELARGRHVVLQEAGVVGRLCIGVCVYLYLQVLIVRIMWKPCTIGGGWGG